MMSLLDDAARAASVPSAARVGADLRAARERLGWTLPAIAGHLRIRMAFLEAIEEGRTADLPGNAYAVGFLRTYAQALGLDPQEIVRRFRAEAAEANRKTELKFPAPVPDRGVPAGAIVLVGALLAVGAYIGWYRMSADRQPAVEMVQPVPERLAPLLDKPPAGAPLPAADTRPADSEPPPPPVPTVSPSSAAAAVTTPAPMAKQPGAPAPVIGVTQAPSAPPSQVMASASPPAAAPVPSPTAADAPKPDETRIVVRAKSDAWVQVRDKAGVVVFNRLMRGGETWAVPPKQVLTLTTGNAGGTELLVDGEIAPSLGAVGTVRRDLLLDPQAIKDGKLTPPAKHT